MSAVSRTENSAQRRQLAFITLGAAAIFVGLRLLPTGTNLSHMDFRVDPKAGNAIEFCDPLNPQFIPVVAARSPVVMTLAAAAAPSGRLDVRVTLKTASGKPIGPADLLVTHTRPLHLLIIDETLADYQHVHPEPSATPGEWTFSFTPREAGSYRIFADFTPAATARGLYASADLDVKRPGGAAAARPASDASGRARRPAEVGASLTTKPSPVRAGQPTELRFEMWNADGSTVPLEPVMGAYAHLVAFDLQRSGFAHLHPVETDLAQRPDARRPTLNFKLTVPRAGRYIVWAQVNRAGREQFIPFALEVGE